MSIQWFPGHMHKARVELAAVLPEIDAVIEVLDARLPWSSANPMLDALVGDRPRLRVLTRDDLADPTLTARWLEALDEEDGTAEDEASGDGTVADESGDGRDDGDGATAGARAHGPRDALATRSDRPATIARIPLRLDALVGGRDAARARRERSRRALIAGIPNVGKSTLINRLAGRRVAKTGDEPAVTRRQQSVPIGGGWTLRDTPGLLWPKLENEAGGYRLAASGAVRDTAMDSAEVALWLVGYLSRAYPGALGARYGGTLPHDDAETTLEAIGRARGCLGAGGTVDLDRAARLVLTEYRGGMLGRLTLETPATRAAERVETRRRREAREAEREARRRERRARRRGGGRGR